jgi:hypothetical protein
MQNHLLSKNERLIIQTYLSEKKKTGNFRNLKYRTIKYYPLLAEEFDLIQKFKDTI